MIALPSPTYFGESSTTDHQRIGEVQAQLAGQMLLAVAGQMPQHADERRNTPVASDRSRVHAAGHGVLRHIGQIDPDDNNRGRATAVAMQEVLA